MIWKVLRQHIKITQLIGIFLGIVLGVGLIGAGVLFYKNTQYVLTENNFWDTQYIVVNKKVSTLDMVDQFRNQNSAITFNQEEIKDFANQSFIEDFAVFTACNFSIDAALNFGDNNFGTQIFLEGVPDRCIDIKTNEWHWKEGDNFIPVILPKAYLDLYNFVFSISQGLPQISEFAAQKAPLVFYVQNHGKTITFNARIVGFSNKINTILAPLSFVEWGNKTFSPEAEPISGRILLKVKENRDTEFLQYIRARNYDIIESTIETNKAMSYLKIITSVVAFFGIVIILLSITMLVISIQLLIQRNKENICNLGILGYSVKQIMRPYLILFISLFTLVAVCVIIGLHIFSSYCHKTILLLNNIESNNALSLSIIMVCGIIVLGLITITLYTYSSLRKTLINAS